MKPSVPAAQERPPGMAAVILLLCIFNVVNVAFYDRSPNLSPLGSIVFFAAGFVLFATASFVVIRFLWLGHNWARWLVIAASLVVLSNLLNLVQANLNLVQQVLTIIEAVFGTWLLYWLNSEKVVRYFRIGEQRWQFGPRTMMIFATLAAVLLGILTYALKR